MTPSSRLDQILAQSRPSVAQSLDSFVSPGFDSVIVRMKEGTERAAVLMCQAQCPGSLTEQAGAKQRTQPAGTGPEPDHYIL
ncbi:hypothetical protein NHX12_002977 [Muraenolepis orangiensis]|uniref:Uncharacterized protein n=1 Tax=Muraenolepis orangiensis TaxID=630683 RepID=A0A9Q0DXM1_9TELE|nr:hypothetical protein NHX12_002977 [Muraenolepis orangiensis]